MVVRQFHGARAALVKCGGVAADAARVRTFRRTAYRFGHAICSASVRGVVLCFWSAVGNPSDLFVTANRYAVLI